MRTSTEYTGRAEECRKLAELASKPEDWAHFSEMAETWEMMLKHQQERSRLRTIALADQFRNALFPSEIAPETPAADDSDERAA
jgi:hypothetical protein